MIPPIPWWAGWAWIVVLAAFLLGLLFSRPEPEQERDERGPLT